MPSVFYLFSSRRAQKNHRVTTLRDLFFILRGRFSEQQIKDSVSKLRTEGAITWEGNETRLDFTTPLSLA